MNADPPFDAAMKDSRKTGDAISRRLREYYDAVKDEPIPDRFLDLLQRLDDADRQHSAQQGAGDER